MGAAHTETLNQAPPPAPPRGRKPLISLALNHLILLSEKVDPLGYYGPMGNSSHTALYMRVSTADQRVDLQRDAITARLDGAASRSAVARVVQDVRSI